jgi:hypothetical protein
MNYQPTYRVTPQKRPLWRRLTPLAWFLIVTGLVLAAMLLAGLFKKFTSERDVPFVLPAASAMEATPLATGPPAATPAPPTLPPPTPMPMSMLMSTSMSTPAQVWWAEQMTCNELNECMPPEQVVNEIIAAYQEQRATIQTYVNELDMTPEQLAMYYTGEILELQLEFVSLVKETGAMWGGATTVKEYDYEVRVPHVVGCEPDGLICFLGETVQGNLTIYEYDLATRQIVNTVHNPQDQQYQGAIIWRYQYDMEDGRWKVEKYHQWVPAPSQ